MRGIGNVNLDAFQRRAGTPKALALAQRAESLCPVTDQPALEDAFFWLTAAAEIEHALMVQYLFAAYSLDPAGAGGMSAEVEDLKAELLQIAREEMGHLISVQNLLLLVGAPLHLGREHSPYASQIYPFRFKLEPLSLDSLAKYVVAESPDRPASEIPSLNTAEKIEAFENRIKPAARRSNDGEAIKNVGPIYHCLVDIVGNRLRNEDVRLDRAAYQARWADWGLEPPGRGLKVLVEDFPQQDPGEARKAASAALGRIGEQGEASDMNMDAEESHFERFFDSYLKLEKIVATLGRVPAWPVVRNPNTSRAPDEVPPQGHMVERVLAEQAAGGRITDARTRRWAELFNLRYRLLLHCLQHGFYRDEPPYQANGDRTLRGFLQYWTFSEMRHVKKLAEKLVQMRRGEGSEHAGPPFELPVTLSLPQFEADRWRLHASGFEASLQIVAALRAEADADDPFLAWLAEKDDQARRFALTVAQSGSVPAGVAPTGFLKTLTTLEEGVRGFDPPKSEAPHGAFWRTEHARFLGKIPPRNREVVKPGDPDGSRLMQRISIAEGVAGRMPRYRPRLPQGRIDHIRDWIAAGAPDDNPPSRLSGEPSPNPEPAARVAVTAAALTATALSFARDIKVLFRDFDRQSMLPFEIDLHDYQSVRNNADAILEKVSEGTMPCDGSWPSERVDRFRVWIEQGFPA